MVHTSKVNFMTEHPVVVTRRTRVSEPVNAAVDLAFDQRMFEVPLPENEGGETTNPYHGTRIVEVESLFVPQTSQEYCLAGHACRIEFRDEVFNRRQLADAMLCTPSTCELCCAGELSPAADVTGSQSESLPMVSDAHLEDRGVYGWRYSPPVPQERPHQLYRTAGRLLDVAFSGNRGRYIRAEIVEGPAGLSHSHFFDSDDF
jgi:hypothetical protein